MVDKPIIFSAPMVRALLEGRKSQTRRIYKVPSGSYVEQGRVWAMTDGCAYGDAALPYAPGDRLYVREAWRVGAWDWNNAQIAVDYRDGPRKEWLPVDDGDMLTRLIYQSRADAHNSGMGLRASYYEYTWSPGEGPCRWRPSIHMPRWASRLTLTVTEVLVQRLQEISTQDCIAEGISADLAKAMEAAGASDLAQRQAYHETYVECYRDLWNSLHGPDAWEADPWVVAVSFTVQRMNIDAVANA